MGAGRGGSHRPQARGHGHVVDALDGVVDQHHLGVDLQRLVDRRRRIGVAEEIVDEGAAEILRNDIAGQQLFEIGMGPIEIGALILADSVTVPGPAPAASNESIEQYEAEKDGFVVTSVTGGELPTES